MREQVRVSESVTASAVADRMVFENVFANLLNQYLSGFIDDVSAKQLKLGAWSGQFPGEDSLPRSLALP